MLTVCGQYLVDKKIVERKSVALEYLAILPCVGSHLQQDAVCCLLCRDLRRTCLAVQGEALQNEMNVLKGLDVLSECLSSVSQTKQHQHMY